MIRFVNLYDIHRCMVLNNPKKDNRKVSLHDRMPASTYRRSLIRSGCGCVIRE